MTGPLATLARILTYARAQRWKLALVIALSLLEMALNAQLSLSFKYLIDHAGSERTAEKLVWVTSALCLSIIIVTWSGLWRDQLYSTATAELIADLRGRLFAHLQRLSASFYTRTAPGDILSRFSNDLVDVERTILNGVPWGIIPTLDAILSTVLVFWLDWRLALLAMLAFPCSMFGPRLLSGRTATAAFARKKAEADLVSAVAENVAAQSLVRAFGLSNYFLRMFHAVNLDARSTSARLGFFALSMERSAVVSTQILQVLVLAGGGYLVFRGSMSVGSFAAFQSIFVTLSLSLAYLAQYVPQLAQAGGAVAHIEELLHEAPQVRDDEKAAELPSLSRGIELRDVRFSYDGSQMNLDKVSLAIECGTSVAFVGPSGSGKSTILSMVMRFYDPVEGTVLVDGHDLRAVSSHSLRAQTAVVFQDNFLLHGSIQDNIRIARPSATAVEIDEAIRQAGLEDFISTLPLGKNTIVGQSRLSGGQRQRLGIARALLRNPRILLLDEATSALDSATEAMINATLEHVSRGRTVLSVTHRLGSAVKADRIFFLDKGRIVEQGTHQQLLALNGAYARMWNKQSGFELSAQGDHARISPDRLRAVPLLAELNDDILTELSRSFSTELYSKDHVLFNEGDAGDRFFILVRGTVEVLKTTAGGGTRRVEVLQDGDVFGEQALLLNAPRSASVRCVAECTALVLTRDKFQTMIDRSPELRWKLRESASIGEYRNDEAVAGLVSPWSKFRHDLLTPVNHIAGYGQILADDFQDSNDAAAAAKAASICSAAKELQAGIDQLLPSGRTPATDVIARLSRELTEPLHRIATAVSAIRSSSQRSRQVLEDALRIETAVTSFRDLLQNSHQPAALAKSRNSSRYNGASTAVGHILVVDDNSTSRDLLCRKLERDGYAVSFAAGGEAAIEIESSHKFDLVLLDVMMPDIDGFQVLQHWKANRTLDRLPVIVTSAMDEVSSAVRCIELGAEDYLTKPFDPVLLKARIGACIEKKRLRDGERARAERLRSALETYGEKGKAVAS